MTTDNTSFHMPNHSDAKAIAETSRSRAASGSVLHLTLKREWFDMIASGEKREEYREIKDYWIKRLSGRSFDFVCFRNGYSKGCPEMLVECKGIEVGYGKQRWGAGSAERFKIKLGRILSLNDQALPQAGRKEAE